MESRILTELVIQDIKKNRAIGLPVPKKVYVTLLIERATKNIESFYVAYRNTSLSISQKSRLSNETNLNFGLLK